MYCDETRVPHSQLVGQTAKRNVSSGNYVSICLCGSANGLQCFVMKLSKHPTVNVISIKQVYNFGTKKLRECNVQLV